MNSPTQKTIKQTPAPKNDEEAIAKRRDDALRQALSTLPKQHKDMKKGKRREKRLEEIPTASEKRD